MAVSYIKLFKLLIDKKRRRKLYANLPELVQVLLEKRVAESLFLLRWQKKSVLHQAARLMMCWILFLKFQIARQPIMKNKDGSRMGRLIQYRLLQSEIQVGLMRPVIYCNERYCENLQQVALNEKLAALLLKIKPERRTMRIKRCFQEVLTNIPENSCIRDFDVLFNPAYKIYRFGQQIFDQHIWQ